jgi:hypothetical protein
MSMAVGQKQVSSESENFDDVLLCIPLSGSDTDSVLCDFLLEIPNADFQNSQKGTFVGYLPYSLETEKEVIMYLTFILPA